ncbi:MAG: hypothetical protein IKF82_01045 [Bacilli bacterium]|nr:hypothetical protein [Bacilli bacterium]
MEKSFKWDLSDKTLKVWNVYFTHWTLVCRATYWEPAEYDDTDIEIDDYVNPLEVLFDEEFEISGKYCKICVDEETRYEKFINLLLKYYKPFLQNVLGKNANFWHNLLGDYLDSFDDDPEYIWDLIVDEMWNNTEFTDELGDMIYDIVEESINKDEDFQERMDEDYCSRY